ncbi:MAG TPA: four helix bundle protein [Gemmatimonadaceae bacterium]|nr:four helix bundle protein [Gemmatimonadaceae bacterium]
MSTDFRVLDAARSVVDEVEAAIETAKPPLIHVQQLRDASGSITWNIREAFGHRAGRERNVFLRHAHGSADEADEQLRVNLAARRLDAPRYRRWHNRLVVIRKMLEALMSE